jgi:hypothetical protein
MFRCIKMEASLVLGAVLPPEDDPLGNNPLGRLTLIVHVDLSSHDLSGVETVQRDTVASTRSDGLL